MPTNLYGPNDNFNLTTSHVIPALIRKFVEAKETNQPHVTIWGDGTPKREFLYVDDLAKACIFVMQTINKQDIINIGTGKDITIMELAQRIKTLTNYSGDIITDPSKPNGTPQKYLTHPSSTP